MALVALSMHYHAKKVINFKGDSALGVDISTIWKNIGEKDQSGPKFLQFQKKSSHKEKQKNNNGENFERQQGI